MEELIIRAAEVMEAHKQELTELDTAIGDSDHGINMARGFAAVKTELESYRTLSEGEILVAVGKTLMRVVSGSAGALYGAAFKAAGKYLTEQNDLSYGARVAAFAVGIEKIQQLGKATEGEKTMLDAMFPALRALQEGKGLAEAVRAAQEAAEHTKDYIATKGRASYVGERSLGHKDPGAASFCLLIELLK